MAEPTEITIKVVTAELQIKFLTVANQLLQAEIARLTGVLAQWEQNQLEATADSYDEGYTDAAEGRVHRNMAAILAALDEDDEQ